MTHYDPGLALDLAHWRIESLQEPRPDALVAARRAMLAAVASAPGRRRRLVALPRLHLHHPRVLTGALAGGLAIAGVTIGIGWQASAGSPLHDVLLTRERLQLAIPGTDALGLRLGFAEQRLADARAGHDPAASLAEAASLLAEDRSELSADHSAGPWARWSGDEAELVALDVWVRSGSASRGAPAPEAEEGAPAPTTPVQGSGTGGGRPAQGTRSASPTEPARGETSGEPEGTAPAGAASPAPSASPGPTERSSPEPWGESTGATSSSAWPRETPGPSSSAGTDG